MATLIQTGRDIAITIATVNFDDQIINGTITFDDATASVETLNGTVDYVVDNEKGSVSLELLQDWGATVSVCDTLWAAADTLPTTAVAVTATINSVVVTLSCLPKRPDFGGSAPDALTTTVTLPIRAISKA